MSFRPTSFGFWFTIARLGLVQAGIGALVVFATSSLNRIMVVELAMPAVIPGALVGFHYAVQMARPRWGYGSDRGGRRTPWILGGMAALAMGIVLAAWAVGEMKAYPGPAVAVAVLAYGLIGAGVGAAGTALLVLLTQVSGGARRAASATVVWMMMIVGFIVTAAVAGHMLTPFSPSRVVATAAVLGTGALALAAVALMGLESTRSPAEPASGVTAAGFGEAFRDVWSERATRRFTLFVFLSMLAYSAQELILEPFAGVVFGLAPADSAKLAGLQHSGLLIGMLAVAVLGSLGSGSRLRSMRIWTAGGCFASAAAALVVAGIGAGHASPVLRAGVVALGVTNGAFSIAAIAGMMQLAGQGRPGREGVRLGLWGAAQAAAFACGGVFGTGLSDLARTALGTPALAYAVVLVTEAVVFCTAAIFALHAFPRQAQERTQASSADLQRWAT